MSNFANAVSAEVYAKRGTVFCCSDETVKELVSDVGFSMNSLRRCKNHVGIADGLALCSWDSGPDGVGGFGVGRGRWRARCCGQQLPTCSGTCLELIFPLVADCARAETPSRCHTMRLRALNFAGPMK